MRGDQKFSKTVTAIWLVGAVGSFILMLQAGRLQRSTILMLLYSVWVLSPFLALKLMTAAAERTSALQDWLKLLLSLVSLAVYAAVVFNYLRLKAGFTFLVVPLVSWVVIAFSVGLPVVLKVRTGKSSRTV